MKTISELQPNQKLAMYNSIASCILRNAENTDAEMAAELIELFELWHVQVPEFIFKIPYGLNTDWIDSCFDRGCKGFAISFPRFQYIMDASIYDELYPDEATDYVQQFRNVLAYNSSQI